MRLFSIGFFRLTYCPWSTSYHHQFRILYSLLLEISPILLLSMRGVLLYTRCTMTSKSYNSKAMNTVSFTPFLICSSCPSAAVKMKSYSNAIVAYTAALRLCGPPWPVRIFPAPGPKTPNDVEMLSHEFPSTSDPRQSKFNDNPQNLLNTRSVELDVRVTSLRLPLLCNRSLALVKRAIGHDCFQAEADALEALSYDPECKKSAYRLEHYNTIVTWVNHVCTVYECRCINDRSSAYISICY